ncbi:uncharacterized protein BO80DRAFT_107368 [Aspergillus ibericus CBS 121593]|uniref:Uncharacterized protein n=1 Tax=Aspergillus ibericus CBS 121593 TaxID=1448316 RepID=A0A395GWX8_9EURO|nr:hypothetical protein BO80DRAFT_107368 [Aspergillus ibericus CBS 121593]RAL00081.1 hypothetical protein BO80DRAFT_107368 [Aspergillus ibericus CBS 121593]
MMDRGPTFRAQPSGTRGGGKGDPTIRGSASIYIAHVPQFFNTSILWWYYRGHQTPCPGCQSFCHLCIPHHLTRFFPSSLFLFLFLPPLILVVFIQTIVSLLTFFPPFCFPSRPVENETRNHPGWARSHIIPVAIRDPPTTTQRGWRLGNGKWLNCLLCSPAL